MSTKEMMIKILSIDDKKLVEIMEYYNMEDTDENRSRFLLSLMIEHYNHIKGKAKNTTKKAFRLKLLTDKLRENPNLTVEELAEILKVTPTTIRNDLKELDGENSINKGHTKRWERVKTERQDRIKELAKQGMWFVDDFAEAVGVHRVTLYRDLEELKMVEEIERSKKELYKRSSVTRFKKNDNDCSDESY